MVVVLSEATCRLMDCGIEACSTGRIAFTRSTVSITLAPGCRRIKSSTAGFPSASPALRRSCTESATVADIGQTHRRAVAVGDDDRQVVHRLLRLVVGGDLPVAGVAIERAFRAVGVGRGNGRADGGRARCRNG